MSVRTTATRLLILVLFLFLASTVIGALLGQPVGLAFAETGSMSPTIDTGDGYVAVPAPVAGPVSEGDIVVFDARNINDGGLVVHRVVGETDEGYITRGDANAVTDQDGDEPPVPDARVQAKVLSVGDYVVTIPQIGTAISATSDLVNSIQQQLAALLGTRAVLGTQGLSYVLVGLGTATYLLSAVAENRGRGRSRETSRQDQTIDPQFITAAMTILLVVVLSLTMIVPGGLQEFQYVSSESGQPGPDVIQRGTAENISYGVPSNGPLPVLAVIEPASDRASVNQSEIFVPGNSEKTVTVTIDAPSETGVRVDAIVEHRYLAFLPQGVLLSLYGVHPWLPIVAINLLAGGLFFGFAIALIGLDPVRISRDRDIPLRVRIRRLLE